MNKRHIALLLCLLLAASLLLGGCGKDERRDTREDVHTIGVVITIDVDNTFKELFVYPGSIADMGEDNIRSTKNEVHVGSFGCTVAQSENYSVWLKDRDGGAYEFANVPFQNADHGVITLEGGLSMALHHTDGTSEEVPGVYIAPGDAPSYSQQPLAQQETFKFNLYNDTGRTLTMVSMREADDPDKGEVELKLDPLESGQYVTISSKLYDHDFDNHEWLLYVKTDAGEAWLSEDTFDPWTAKTVHASVQNGTLVLDVETNS